MTFISCPSSISLGGLNTAFQIGGTGAAGASFSLVRYTPGGGGAVYVGASTRAVEGSGTFVALQPGDGVVSMEGRGDDGFGFTFGGNIAFKVDAPVSLGVMPLRMDVSLGDPTTGSVNAAFQVDSKRNFGNNIAASGHLDNGGADHAVCLKDVTSPPTTNAPNGGQWYSQNGACYWRGSAGTVTMVAPA